MRRSSHPSFSPSSVKSHSPVAPSSPATANSARRPSPFSAKISGAIPSQPIRKSSAAPSSSTSVPSPSSASCRRHFVFLFSMSPTRSGFRWSRIRSFGTFMPQRGRPLAASHGRLKPGVSIAQAQAEIDAISATARREFPTENRGWQIRMVPLQTDVVGRREVRAASAAGRRRPRTSDRLRQYRQLASHPRDLSRSQEIAVRTALGAGRASHRPPIAQRDCRTRPARRRRWHRSRLTGAFRP